MYLDLQNFTDATRVAKKEAPHLLPDLAAGAGRGGPGGQGGNLTGEDFIQNAKVAEDCRDYNKAIENYLSVSPDNMEDFETISRVWKRAVQLA